MAFLAAGWIEAALQLHRLSVIPDGFPDWVAYGVTQALRFGRGNEKALAFASKQKPSPALDVLIGELLLAEGKTDQALKRLNALATKDSDVGFRAAWLWCLTQIERGKLEQARRMVQTQPRLRDSTTGKELLARIALLEGNNDEADQLYAALEKASPEAKVHLARRAFAQKNWAEAKRLTEELVLQFPDNMQFRANLRAIVKAKKKE